jgi:hypothetical protein
MRQNIRPVCRNARGAVNKIIIAVMVAIGIGGVLAVRLLREGATDFGYVFFMSMVGVVAMAIVAPGLFSARGDRPPWERTRKPDNKPSHNQSNGN